jgi:hypothetical protein
MDEFTEEDVEALAELEERALRKAAEDENLRRSDAMAESMRYWQS